VEILEFCSSQICRGRAGQWRQHFKAIREEDFVWRRGEGGGTFVSLFLTSKVNNYHIAFIFVGSLPPSPADSGVSDVDPSSSSHNSDDENRLHRQHRNAMGEYIF
jgi:hypothetical protein